MNAVPLRMLQKRKLKKLKGSVPFILKGSVPFILIDPRRDLSDSNIAA